MDTIQIWYIGEGSGESLFPLTRTLERQLPEYKIRLGGVLSDTPTLAETVTTTIEAIRILSVMVPWDWKVVGGAFGLGAVAGAGEAVGKASVDAARTLFREIVTWVRHQPQAEGRQIPSATVVIYIVNADHGRFGQLEIDPSSEDDPILTPITQNEDPAG